MANWGEYVAAFAVFFITHTLPLRPSIRPRLQELFGARAFTIGYSFMSVAVLAWLISAAGRAPYLALWDRAAWQSWAPLLGMAVVCLIVTFSLARPNPFSFGGSNDGSFDANHPGVIRWTRHPLLVALGLWAGVHLVPNGDLAHVLVFGSFAAFAFLGMRLVDRRKRREMGPEHWRALFDRVQKGPLIPRPASWPGCAARLVMAMGLYGLLLFLHPVLFGVSPLT